ncbi:hypothetical protein GCU67_08990 [Modestobacter muralis]|uniref:Uncharacterized protein n=1 Tax=Modestobacter muralis TaxID=1608614 RepID=A0A6P0EUL3_9ACTN|nr:hypothetical protein [Modestobacter muralis]NEK94306.1 hypothetical protein [Modestobacter muralis]NEN51194.1 hypothetical protein [Modestobacter muralis]
MVVEALMVAGVLLLPGPALVLGATRVQHRLGRSSVHDRADRVELALLVTGRLLGLLLLLGLSAVTLLACIGALVRERTLPSLVYVFFVADLLVATLVLLTVGRRDRRPGRRSTSPARR